MRFGLEAFTVDLHFVLAISNFGWSETRPHVQVVLFFRLAIHLEYHQPHHVRYHLGKGS